MTDTVTIIEAAGQRTYHRLNRLPGSALAEEFTAMFWEDLRLGDELHHGDPGSAYNMDGQPDAECPEVADTTDTDAQWDAVVQTMVDIKTDRRFFPRFVKQPAIADQAEEALGLTNLDVVGWTTCSPPAGWQRINPDTRHEQLVKV